MRIIAFPSVSRGAGQSSLVFHLAWMYADLGVPVVVADFDPQARLTRKFLDTAEVDDLWSGDKATRMTVHRTLRTLLDSSGEPDLPTLIEHSPGIDLLPGDPALAEVEDELAEQWLQRIDPNAPTLGTLGRIRRVLERTAEEYEASLVLLDVGPNPGALNRAVLMTADAVVIPLATDVSALHGLRSFGPTLWSWRREREELLASASGAQSGVSCLPAKAIPVAGCVLLDRAFLLYRPYEVPDRWAQRLSDEYVGTVLHEPGNVDQSVVGGSPPLARLKHHPSLLPMAREARKPMFFLQPADGVIGSNVRAVLDCYSEYRDAAKRVAERCDIPLPCNTRGHSQVPSHV